MPVDEQCLLRRDDLATRKGSTLGVMRPQEKVLNFAEDKARELFRSPTLSEGTTSKLREEQNSPSQLDL